MQTHHTKPGEPDSLFSRELIESQHISLSNVSRFPFMRFVPELESAFEQFRYDRLTKRIPIICTAGIILFCVFSILDLFTLPLAVAQISIPIRLFLICPLIALIMFLGEKRIAANIFFHIYFGVFLVSGAAIVGIIYTADLHNFLLAYDGILLHLVFGYFVMSLPYTMAIYGGLIVSSIYVFMSSFMSLQAEQIASNSIFIIGLNFIGAIGCYLQERARRFLFLNQELVAIAKEKDKKEIASKTRLVATASHDLRQPLHAMHLLIETLNDQLPEGPQKGIVKSLDISIKQLSQQLNTLLDISKLSVGIMSPKLERVDLNKKLTDFCYEQRLRFLEAGIQLKYDKNEPIHVYADSLLLDRIIRNVIENIFTHSQANELYIDWSVTQNKVHLALKDNGIGIPEEEMEAIYDEFHQTSKYTNPGMGLGLNIVKQLAELQDIDYGLASKENQGACFWFDIPLANDETITELKPQFSTCMIESDASEFAKQWTKHLQSWGHEIRFFPTDASEDFVDNLCQIHAKLPEDMQLLIINLPQSDPTEHDVTQLCQWLKTYWHIRPILFFVPPHSHAYDRLKSKDVECLETNIRPAKLRLVLNHLLSVN